MFQGLQLPRVEVGINPTSREILLRLRFKKPQTAKPNSWCTGDLFFLLQDLATLLIRQEKGERLATGTSKPVCFVQMGLRITETASREPTAQ